MRVFTKTQFLFYTGPVVLKSVLPLKQYNNFLSLFVATLILSSSKYLANMNSAVALMEYFVKTFKLLYGSKNVSHNIHNMLHLPEDVSYMGTLDKFSAFPFENKLQQLKRLVRKGDKPLSQVVKRIYELERHSENLQNEAEDFKPSREHEYGPLLIGTNNPQYMELNLPQFKLKIKPPNNCYASVESDIILIENIAHQMDTVVLIGRKFIDKESFFTKPCHSSDFGIFFVKNLGILEVFYIEDIDTKCVKLDYKNGFVIFPLIHNINQ